MQELQSISQWIAGLKAGELDAVELLWNRYRFDLARLATGHLAGVPKGIGDEEDVAQCAFYSLCRGFASGRFEGVRNRDDLWWLLLTITKQKSVDHIRKELAQKRGDGKVQSEAPPGASDGLPGGIVLDQLIGKEPTPEFLVMLDEQHRRLLAILGDETLRRIASARIEGYSTAEIAASIGVSIRSIDRKLRIIRERWAKELAKND
ncbi:MAG: hypothetical protein JNG90_09590 [Planctomycetaceae bacterium]|nr:hypothetical protein [Planctomycetaceae bacterium]